MARFCGIYSPKDPSLMRRADVEAMLGAFLRHTPQTEHRYFNDAAGFGIAALSHDVAGGPDWAEDSNHVTAFSGHIASGPYTFERAGPAAASFAAAHLAAGGPIEDLAGQFAVAAWEKDSATLTLAIDPLGTWPLFTIRDESTGVIVFASEAKCLLAHPLGKREADPGALAYYLFMTHVSPPHAAFRGMKRLRLGESLRVCQDGSVSAAMDWSYPPAATEPTELDEWSIAVAQRHRDTLKNLVAGHQKVGLLLGAGIDSSLLYGRLKTYHPEVEVVPITAFHPPSPLHKRANMDLPFAQQLADHWGDRLVEAEVSMAALGGLLEPVLRQTDQPFMNIGNNFVLGGLADVAAENGISLLISGQGAGENFGVNSWVTVREEQSQGRLTTLPEIEDHYMGKPLQFSLERLPKLLQDPPQDIGGIIRESYRDLLDRVSSPELFDKVLYGIRPVIPREHILHSTIAVMNMRPIRLANAFYDWHTIAFGESIPPVFKGAHDSAWRKIVTYHDDRHLIPPWVFDRPKRGLPGFEFDNGEFPNLERRLLSREVVEKQGIFNPDYFEKSTRKRRFRKSLLLAQVWLDIHVFQNEETFDLVRKDRHAFAAAAATAS